jgi:tRNA U34 5-methylaminomethyl-2-thiouridine-forming methyltransferase MnmC
MATADGSPTFFNEEFQEHYHAMAGAAKEAMVKFAEPCLLPLLEQRPENIAVLDVCFGLGYNTAAAIDLIRARLPSCRVAAVGLENDDQVLRELQDLTPPFASFAIIKEAARLKRYEKDGVKIDLLMGDARETIKTVHQEFDAVFLDPFSPKRCPELWTKEFLTDIKERMRKGAVLSTYSCATAVRQNMRDIGLLVKNGVVFARKAPSTLAIRQ